MYSLNVPVSAIRTKIRQQFEKHRYVSQLKVVDVLLFKSHAEYQVGLARVPCSCSTRRSGWGTSDGENIWRIWWW